MSDDRMALAPVTGPSAASLDDLCINTIRMLSIDAVQAANSGHPGMPMGAATMAYVLWTRHLRHNPANPEWADPIGSCSRPGTRACCSTACCFSPVTT